MLETDAPELNVLPTLSAESKKSVADYLGIDPENPALYAYVTTCVEHGFGIFSGKVWLEAEDAPSRDGDGGPGRLRPAMGRDAFLDVAIRSEDYEGMEYDVVCSKDLFKKTVKAGVPSITHATPKINEETDDLDFEGWRGKILGAYCVVYRKGRKPTYFFAPLEEYVRLDDEGHRRDFWKYVSAMIIKCAQSAALRFAFGITGVIPADEKRVTQSSTELPTKEIAPEDYVASLEHLDPERREEICKAVVYANDLDPNRWSLAKLKMRLEGGDDGETLLAEIQAELPQLERETPAPSAS